MFIKNIKHQTDWSNVSLPLTQLSLEKPAVQKGSRQCGPSGYSGPGPNSGQLSQG